MISRAQREKKRRQQIAEQQKRVTKLDTTKLNPKIATLEKLTFVFMNLDLNNSRFSCNAGDGTKLMSVFDNLKKHSNYDAQSIRSRPNSHFIPEDQVGAHGLRYLLDLGKISRLFQLGSGGQPERIIGYFESNSSNIFNVCLLDLNHKLSD